MLNLRIHLSDLSPILPDDGDSVWPGPAHRPDLHHPSHHHRAAWHRPAHVWEARVHRWDSGRRYRGDGRPGPSGPRQQPGGMGVLCWDSDLDYAKLEMLTWNKAITLYLLIEINRNL